MQSVDTAEARVTTAEGSIWPHNHRHHQVQHQREPYGPTVEESEGLNMVTQSSTSSIAVHPIWSHNHRHHPLQFIPNCCNSNCHTRGKHMDLRYRRVRTDTYEGSFFILLSNSMYRARNRSAYALGSATEPAPPPRGLLAALPAMLLSTELESSMAGLLNPGFIWQYPQTEQK
jgi:hypothetical protein